MPGDRLTLSVLVGREVELVDFLERGLEFRDDLLAVLGHHVHRLEVIVHVDAQPRPLLALHRHRDVGGALGQIADVSDGGLDDVVGSEHALNSRRLRDRLDDD